LAPNTHQIVDNNPVITANGVVWTVRIRTSAVDVELEKGQATYEVEHLAMTDSGTLFNAFYGNPSHTPGVPGPGIPSTVSFRRSRSGDPVDSVLRSGLA